MLVPVNSIEIVDGEVVYSPSSMAGDDVIRAARLLIAGKEEELEIMKNTRLFELTDESELEMEKLLE